MIKKKDSRMELSPNKAEPVFRTEFATYCCVVSRLNPYKTLSKKYARWSLVTVMF